jgi:hypothetical protein
MATYTAKTEEEIRGQAETEYQSYYDLLRQSAQQDYETADLLLGQQIEGLGTTYGKQAEESRKEYDLAYSQSAREALSRGMGRSSYAVQTLANVDQAGIEAKQGIMDAQAAAEANLEAQRKQLVSQLTEKLTTYDASQAADILKRIAEIQETEYAKQYQAERDAAADAQWQAEYNEMVRQFDASLAASKKSSSSSSKKTTAVTEPTYDAAQVYQNLISALSNADKPATWVDKTVADETGDPEVHLNLAKLWG